mmetsp:Transcript_41496/g.120064  ORF Transcript_41496/g.120064 Transcript_41496/m.120064 type:complete len:219 (+) Transcript_41496:533-1189(+)
MIRVCPMVASDVLPVIICSLHSVHLPDAPVLHEARDHHVLPRTEAPITVPARCPKVVRRLLGEEVKVCALDGLGLHGEEDRAVYVVQPRREVVGLGRPQEDVVAAAAPREVGQRVPDQAPVEGVHVRGALVLLRHDAGGVDGHEEEVRGVGVLRAAVAVEEEAVHEDLAGEHALAAAQRAPREVRVVDEDLDAGAGAALGSQAQEHGVARGLVRLQAP